MTNRSYVVTLLDIEEDACTEVLRQHVSTALRLHLPYITAEVVCEDR